MGRIGRIGHIGRIDIGRMGPILLTFRDSVWLWATATSQCLFVQLSYLPSIRPIRPICPISPAQSRRERRPLKHRHAPFGKTPAFAWYFINNAMMVVESDWQKRINILYKLLQYIILQFTDHPFSQNHYPCFYFHFLQLTGDVPGLS